MPATKEQLRRLMELDKFFQNGHRWKAIDLLRKLEQEADIQISDRTLKDDLAYLITESNGILIRKKIGREWLWFYEESTYSHFKKSLLPAEVADLRKMIVTFKEWGDLPFWQEIELLLNQFETRFSFDNKPNRKLIEFQKPISIGGSQWLKMLYECVDKRNVVKIVHRSLRKGNNVTVEVLPLLLKEYNNRWWLIVWSGSMIMPIALETIYDVEFSETEIEEPLNFDPETYFNNILGVTKNQGEIETILLRISPESVNYLITKPLHESQKPMNDEGTEITLRLIPNFELQQAILQYGPQIEVLEPESLRKAISDKLKEASQIYN
ncbi:putative DNA-binding transcriptional regulator YafY [Spirosoma lacussanchae]|uniref:helix-turn-helix transcriptional regulator n=1 Tax=Spirosoma lacussanchae TaxID=1884249 RepID=UPI001485DF1B|nr:WYL domain-containing protein [Spirosoma lacussanchae]